MRVPALLPLCCVILVLTLVNVNGFPTSSGNTHENTTLEPLLDKTKSEVAAALLDEYVQDEIQHGVKLHKASQEAKHLASLLEQRAQEAQHHVLDLLNQNHLPHPVKDKQLTVEKREHRHQIGEEDTVETYGNPVTLESWKKGIEGNEYYGDNDKVDHLRHDWDMDHRRYGPLLRDYREGFSPSHADNDDRETYHDDLRSHGERIPVRSVDRNVLAAFRIAAMQEKLKNAYAIDSDGHNPYHHHQMHDYRRYHDDDHRPIGEDLAWYKRPDLLLHDESEED